jgi:hypothetical protein
MGQLFIENRFERLTGWINKFTADQQSKLITWVIGDKYDSSECGALAGVVVAVLILMISRTTMGLISFICSITPFLYYDTYFF